MPVTLVSSKTSAPHLAECLSKSSSDSARDLGGDFNYVDGSDAKGATYDVPGVTLRVLSNEVGVCSRN